MEVRQSYTLQSHPPGIFSPHPTPHPVTTVLLPTFPKLCFPPHDYSATTDLYFLIPPLLSPRPPAPAPPATISLVSVYEPVPILVFIYLVWEIF